MKTEIEKHKRILVVDDEEVILRLLVRLFKNSDYDLVTANSVKDGISKLNDSDFQLLLTDLRMPDGKGTDVMRHFKEKFPLSKMIIMTGSLEPQNDIDMAADLKIETYLAKPFDLDAVRATIRKALND